MQLLQKTINSIGNLNKGVMDKAQERLDSLLKPPGSLGKLEKIAKQLAGITGKINNHVDNNYCIR